MKRGRTERETCELNGWGVGTRLAGDEGHGREVIRITAIGEESILARQEDGVGRWEMMWTLRHREWSEVL